MAKGIGANGNIPGYLLDSEHGQEFGCMWRGTSHEFDLFADEYTGEWNEELYTYTKRYGDLEIVISPSGRYSICLRWLTFMIPRRTGCTKSVMSHTMSLDLAL